MKKSGLSLLFFLLIITFIFAQDEKGSLVSVTVTPDVLISGIPLNLTFIVDHPNPEDVIVTSPSFPGSLTLDRILKYPMMPGASNEVSRGSAQLKTVIEYRLIPNTSGIIALNPFLIETPQGITETPSFSFIIRNPVIEQRYITVRLYWENIQSGSVTAGDRITLILRAQTWTSRQPPASFFMPEVPQGVILSSQSVSADERDGGILLKLTLIPLTAGEFNLPARVLEYEDVRFQIPALNIRINSRN